MTNRNSEKAFNKFVSNIEDCSEMLTKIQELVENHLDKNPEKINWSDVGDTGALKEKLSEITEIFGI